MIDQTRRPANIGIHEWFMHLQEPRQRPHWQTPTGDRSPLAAWVEFEREWLARIEQRPEAAELLYMLLVAAKRRPEVKQELEGIYEILQSVERAGDDGSQTTGAEG